MNVAEYRDLYGSSDDAAPGWDALDRRLKEVYGEQEPRHWGAIIKHMLGGPDPIDGVSAYECRDGGSDHLHFSTFGYSSLYYDEESVGEEWSGYGFEMTFRLASPLPPAEEPSWVINLFQNLARYVFKSGKPFGQFHWIPANGPIRHGSDTDLVGLAFVIDPVLGSDPVAPRSRHLRAGIGAHVNGSRRPNEEASNLRSHCHRTPSLESAADH